MQPRAKTILNRMPGFRIEALMLTIFLFPLVLSLPISPREIFQIHPSVAAAADSAEDFESALEALQKKYGFPGVTAAYVLPDGTARVAAAGVADREAGAPMTVQARMLSASIGKTFVAATAVALMREGVLNLDIPVSRWMGDRQWFSRLPNHNDITLRHLLTHSSGLPDHVHLDRFAVEVSRRWHEKDNPFQPEDLIGFILDMPPLFEAGKGWAYTDTGYILIGLVIEAATGRDCFDHIMERFLIPLGLTLTTPADRRSLPGLVAGYMAAGNTFGFPQKTITADGGLAWHPGLEWTGGGLVSNSLDLARWGAALFEGTAMPGSYLDNLLDSIPIDPDTPNIRYGAGIAVYQTGPLGPVYGHGGWIPGYSSSLRHYADHGITIAFQINTDLGIADASMPFIADMEIRLAKIVSAAVRQ